MAELELIEISQVRSKGQLLSFKEGIIKVKCLEVVATSSKNDKRQNKICESCSWHSHPKRREGWLLLCDMRQDI